MAGAANILRRGHQDSLQHFAGGSGSENIDRANCVGCISCLDRSSLVVIGACGKMKQPLRAKRIERGAEGHAIKNVSLLVKTCLPCVQRLALIEIQDLVSLLMEIRNQVGADEARLASVMSAIAGVAEAQ